MWFVCLALLVIQLDISLAYNCPRPSGLFTDPERCTHYYECENSMPTSKVCGTGLFFNEKQKICDWPTSVDQSRCSGSGSSGGLNPNSNINSNSNSNSNANNGPDYSNIHHSNHIGKFDVADNLIHHLRFNFLESKVNFTIFLLSILQHSDAMQTDYTKIRSVVNTSYNVRLARRTVRSVRLDCISTFELAPVIGRNRWNARNTPDQ